MFLAAGIITITFKHLDAMDTFQHLWDTYCTAELYISSVGKLLFYLHVTLLCCFVCCVT